MNTLDSFTTQDGNVFKLIKLTPTDDLESLVWKPVAWLPGSLAIVSTVEAFGPEGDGRMFLEKLAEKIGGDFGGPYCIMRLDEEHSDRQEWLGSDESPDDHVYMREDRETWVDDRYLGRALEFPAFREAVAEVKRLLRRDAECRDYTRYTIVDHKLNPVRVLESAKIMPLPKHALINLRVQPKAYDYDADGILQEVQ